MKIKAGERFKVVRGRKYPVPYFAKATKDFDTETDEWWSAVLDQEEEVQGASIYWEMGDDLPLRRGIDVIEKVE